MLTKDDLLKMDTIPHINDVSLKLYKEFCLDILFNRRFHYYFTDGSNIIVEFREWGIYHMLGIQHIDYKISKNNFFDMIDSGLSFDYFRSTKSIKNRFRDQKERITMFPCVYSALRYGRVFYVPDKLVQNTVNVSVDYLLFREISGKGLNIGIRYECGRFIPLTILVSRAININKYINYANEKVVQRLKILSISNDEMIEDIIYTDNFILHH